MSNVKFCLRLFSSHLPLLSCSPFFCDSLSLPFSCLRLLLWHLLSVLTLIIYISFMFLLFTDPSQTPFASSKNSSQCGDEPQCLFVQMSAALYINQMLSCECVGVCVNLNKKSLVLVTLFVCMLAAFPFSSHSCR